jgi:flagellar biosynthesis/type III secretory pathway protein FliH
MAMTPPSFYCFPDLAPKQGRGALPAERVAPAFQRMVPGASGGECGSTALEGGAIGRSGTLRHASPEEVEQAAYCRGFADGERNGYEQGERAGNEAARKELASLMRGLKHLLEELEGLRRREARGFEKELVELALAVARKVVGREVAAQPEGVAHLLRDALGRIEHAGPLTIRMNPRDLELLTGGQAQVLDGLTDSGRVRFEADASLSAGGCVIESDAGDIDARVEQRFRIVEEALREEARVNAGATGTRR